MLSLFPWRRSLLQTQVLFKRFLTFTLIDNRSGMPTNVLLRKACWSALSVRWFGFASSTSLWGSLLFAGYNMNSDTVQIKFVFPQIAKGGRYAPRSNWVIKWNGLKYVTEIMRGWFLFIEACYGRRSTPGISSKKKMFTGTILTGQKFECVTGRLQGGKDTQKAFPDARRTGVMKLMRIPVEHLTFYFEEYSTGWLSLRRLNQMSATCNGRSYERETSRLTIV